MHAFVNQNGLKCQEMVDKSVQLARKIRIPSKQASPDALPPPARRVGNASGCGVFARNLPQTRMIGYHRRR